MAKDETVSDEEDVWNDPDIIPVVNEGDEIEETQQYPATVQHKIEGNISESQDEATGSIDKLKAFSPPDDKFFIGELESNSPDNQIREPTQHTSAVEVGNTLGDFAKINYAQANEEEPIYKPLAPLTDAEKLAMAEER